MSGYSETNWAFLSVELNSSILYSNVSDTLTDRDEDEDGAEIDTSRKDSEVNTGCCNCNNYTVNIYYGILSHYLLPTDSADINQSNSVHHDFLTDYYIFFHTFQHFDGQKQIPIIPNPNIRPSIESNMHIALTLCSYYEVELKLCSYSG